MQLEVNTLINKIDSLQMAFERLEKEVLLCQSIYSQSINSSNENSAWEEFKSIFTKQYVGLSIGVVTGLICRFFDQKLASRIAKKYNIRQKEIMKSAFPTFICLLQFLLRSRSKNSKLASLLSLLKKTPKEFETENCPPDTNLQSQSKNSNSKPEPLTSFSSVGTDLDSVFSDAAVSKPKVTHKTKSKSVSARYRKKSNVVLKIESR